MAMPCNIILISLLFIQAICYQIYAYVKNRDSDNTGKVSGLLLYAKTDEEITPDLSACFGRNRIMVKTLDLNKTFDEITMQLESIADELA